MVGFFFHFPINGWVMEWASTDLQSHGILHLECRILSHGPLFPIINVNKVNKVNKVMHCLLMEAKSF